MKQRYQKLCSATLKTEFFENNDVKIYLCEFSEVVFFKHKYKVTDDFCDLKFVQHSVDRKHLMLFQNEICIFKFQRSVHRAYVDWRFFQFQDPLTISLYTETKLLFTGKQQLPIPASKKKYDPIRDTQH